MPRVLITGGTGGTGYQTARVLARSGAPGAQPRAPAAGLAAGRRDGGRRLAEPAAGSDAIGGQDADAEELLEIEAEDVGGTSKVASQLATLASQHGNAYFRFVTRVRNPGPHRPATVMTGATFPATRPSMDDPAAQGAWLEIQRERFGEFHRQLVDQGWRPVGHGAHWWSVIYRRAAADDPAGPADAGATGR
jgi:hypothetical protein